MAIERSAAGRSTVSLSANCRRTQWQQLAAYDRYPWEYNTFILGGDVILIENDLLADALNALPQDNRDILLMYWFLENGGP